MRSTVAKSTSGRGINVIAWHNGYTRQNGAPHFEEFLNFTWPNSNHGNMAQNKERSEVTFVLNTKNVIILFTNIK